MIDSQANWGTRMTLQHCTNTNVKGITFVVPWKWFSSSRESWHPSLGDITGCVYFMIFYTVLSLHMTTKSLIYLILVRDNEERLKYCDEIFYPNMARPSKHATFFNRIVFSFGCLNLMLWFHNCFKLMNNSIINSDRYRAFSVSQLNLAYLGTIQHQT